MLHDTLCINVVGSSVVKIRLCTMIASVYNQKSHLTDVYVLPDTLVFERGFMKSQVSMYSWWPGVYNINRLWVVCFFFFWEGLWHPEEPTVVAADYCGWPCVSWTLGLHSAVGQEVRVMHATLPIAVEPLTTISTSQRDCIRCHAVKSTFV